MQQKVASVDEQASFFPFLTQHQSMDFEFRRIMDSWPDLLFISQTAKCGYVLAVPASTIDLPDTQQQRAITCTRLKTFINFKNQEKSYQPNFLHCLLKTYMEKLLYNFQRLFLLIVNRKGEKGNATIYFEVRVPITMY